MLEKMHKNNQNPERVKCTYLLTYLPAMGFPLNVGGKAGIEAEFWKKH